MVAKIYLNKLVFAYYAVCCTKLPEKQQKLLPDWTNFGRVQNALELLELNTKDIDGYADAATNLQPSYNTQTITTRHPSHNPTPPTTQRPSFPPHTPYPTMKPTLRPSYNPTNKPSVDPTYQPTITPSMNPSITTAKPSNNPITTSTTMNPTIKPTYDPTYKPTNPNDPTKSPIVSATTIPTTLTTIGPTKATFNPTTSSPTNNPSYFPTKSPTSSNPTKTPTLIPTEIPTSNPTIKPSQSPTKLEVNAVDTTLECDNDGTTEYEYIRGDTIKCTINQSPKNINATVFALLIKGGYYDCDSSVKSPYASTSTEANYPEYTWCYLSDMYYTSFDEEYQINVLTNVNSVPQAGSKIDIIIIAYNFGSSEWIPIYPTKTSFKYVSQYSDYVERELPVELSADVTIIFGGGDINTGRSTCDDKTHSELKPDTSFNIYSTVTQLNLLYLCDRLKYETNKLLYRTTDQYPCLMREFKEYINNKNEVTFPISNKITMNQQMYNFLKTSGSLFRAWISYSNDTNDQWSFNAQTSKIIYYRQLCKTQINKNWGATKLYNDGYLKWEKWINDYNSNNTISVTGKQTSGYYIIMEAEVQFLRGFMKSVIFTIILCGIVMFFFTKNIFLIILVCLYIIIIVIWVVGIFNIFDWEFGIIEIICIPTVIGLTIDYQLHITHSYINSKYDLKKLRSKNSIDKLGISVLSSSITTLGSMFVLYFSTIVIFSDIGLIVGITVSFGILLSLFVTPNILYYFGPQYNQCQCIWIINKCNKLCCNICKKNKNNIQNIQQNLQTKSQSFIQM